MEILLCVVRFLGNYMKSVVFVWVIFRIFNGCLVVKEYVWDKGYNNLFY